MPERIFQKSKVAESYEKDLGLWRTKQNWACQCNILKVNNIWKQGVSVLKWIYFPIQRERGIKIKILYEFGESWHLPASGTDVEISVTFFNTIKMRRPAQNASLIPRGVAHNN